MKLFIQRKYRGDLHYVWCSELFDSKTAPKYSVHSHVPASSNPADIYKILRKDVEGQDRHSAKIAEQKASMMQRAIEWAANGEISDLTKDDMLFEIDHATFDQWRPLIYVIPYDMVKPRLRPVPAAKRAGLGAEYIIVDLAATEFDIIEI